MRIVAIVALAVLAGCRAAPPPAEPDGPPTELAEPAASLERPPRAPRDPQPGSTDPARSSPGGPTPSPGDARPYRVLGSVKDPSGDGGLQAPRYADIKAVRIDGNDSSARVTVRMSARVPNPMPSGEQMAVGIDLYRRHGQTESDYQLYASGTQEGWLAYLDTPGGFVEYPGSFGIGGDSLVFTVPWSALGGIKGQAFDGFLDWDRERPVLNAAGEDHTARARFTR